MRTNSESCGRREAGGGGKRYTKQVTFAVYKHDYTMSDSTHRRSNTDIDEDHPPPVDMPRGPSDLIYAVDDVPPWYLCIVLGLQQYLTMFGGTLTVPLLLAPFFCMDKDNIGISELISTIFFVSGLCTLLQTTIGCRLPIVQGSTFSFLTPTIAIMSLPEWCCPFTDKNQCGLNATDIPEVGSDGHRAMWHSRIAEIQGAIIVSALFQVVIGFSGIMGFVLRFIGPLAIVPTITLIGLALVENAGNYAAEFWWISLLTMFLITLFSQCLRYVKIPVPVYRRGKGCGLKFVSPFSLLPVLLGICLAWLLCFILTVSGVLTSEPDTWGYRARTDLQTDVVENAPWFRFPYPGQWGTPTVSVAGVFAMLSAVLASMVESVGDYYACARLSGAPPPPDHAINRGIGIEGIGCILAGAWGSGNGTTSISQNIGAIGITKVGSRRVIQFGGIIMILLGCLGKFGALFMTIPNPVIGGMFIVTFGMVSSVGLSSLQFVDLNSSRNLFILGFSIFFGLTLPNWMAANPGSIQTGSTVADQILTVLCRTSMFVGGFFGFVLDNTIPGTDEERGVIKWRQMVHKHGDHRTDNFTMDHSTYDIPLVQKYLNRWRWTSYIPFFPNFKGFGEICSCRPKTCPLDARYMKGHTAYVNEAEELGESRKDPDIKEALDLKENHRGINDSTRMTHL